MDWKRCGQSILMFVWMYLFYNDPRIHSFGFSTFCTVVWMDLFYNDLTFIFNSLYCDFNSLRIQCHLKTILVVFKYLLNSLYIWLVLKFFFILNLLIKIEILVRNLCNLFDVSLSSSKFSTNQDFSRIIFIQTSCYHFLINDSINYFLFKIRCVKKIEAIEFFLEGISLMNGITRTQGHARNSTL